MAILLTALGLILAVAAVAVIRALALKPTFDPNTAISLENTPRAEEYGKKLAEMIRCETISRRGCEEENLPKFREFHKILDKPYMAEK